MYDVATKTNRHSITKTKKVNGREIERFPAMPYDNRTIVDKYFSGNVQAFKDAIERGGAKLLLSFQMRQNYFVGMQKEAEQAAAWGLKLYIDIEGTPWLEDKYNAFLSQNPHEVLVEWDRSNPPKCFEDLKKLFEEKMEISRKINEQKTTPTGNYEGLVDIDLSDLDEDVIKENVKSTSKAKNNKATKNDVAIENNNNQDVDIDLSDLDK